MSYTINTLDDVKTFFSREFTEPIFYICTDPLHGLGLEKIIPNYHIICLDDSPIVDLLLKDNIKVFCLEKELGKKNLLFRSSRHVLAQPRVLDYIKKHSLGKGANLLFLKPFFEAKLLILKAGGTFKARVLNTSPQINRIFENKVSFFDKVKDLKLVLPKGVTLPLKEAEFHKLKRNLGEKLVVQFGRGWAGNTTYFISHEEELQRIQKSHPYPNLKVKVSEFIEGETLTNNACVTRFGTLVGYPFWQITGIPQFTKSPGGTCGNEWSNVELSDLVKTKIFKQTEVLGNFMSKNGFYGFFGLDIIVKRNTNDIYITENNARLTASTPMYTQLELESEQIPLLIFHIFEFLKVDHQFDLKSLKSMVAEKLEGGQLVVRNTNDTPLKIKEKFKAGVYKWEDKRGLTFRKSAYSIEELKESNEFLILPTAKERIINPNIEYLRIQTRGSLLNNNGELKPFVFNIVDEIKSKIL